MQPIVGYKKYTQTTLAVTKYLIGHSLKIQADASYNSKRASVEPDDRWQLRFQVELGL